MKLINVLSEERSKGKASTMINTSECTVVLVCKKVANRMNTYIPGNQINNVPCNNVGISNYKWTDTMGMDIKII